MTEKIIVASNNPVKIEAARLGFVAMFPNVEFDIEGVSVPSNVSDQPMTVEETIQGATYRAQNARSAKSDADYWVGIEGGISDTELGMQCFAWIIVMGREGVIGRGQTAIFYLPEEVSQLVRQGIELGHADDQVFGRENSKQKNGAIGLLSDDAVDRTSYYVQAMIMALIPFKNNHLKWM